jgi:hypothetical protein
MGITHQFVSAKSDGADASKVQPSNWNADHVGGMVYLGAWNSGTTYAAGDVVMNDESVYVCTAASTNDEPPNASYWDLLIAKGDHGAPNLLINGGFDFFQRQVPATLTSRSDDTYGPDRWIVLTQTAGVQCNRVAGDVNSVYAGNVKQIQASAQRIGMLQIVESVTSKQAITARAQARVKCSANQNVRIALLEWRDTADAVTSDVVNDWTNGTFTGGNFFLGSGRIAVVATAAVLVDANTWTDISVSGAVSSSCNNLLVMIWTEGTLAQNGTLAVTEAGLYPDVAYRPWNPRPPTLELQLCQRYYQKSYNVDVAPGTNTYEGSIYTSDVQSWNAAAGTQALQIRYETRMRAAATVTLYTPAGVSGQILANGAGKACHAATGSDMCAGWAVNDGTTVSGPISFGGQYTAEIEL